ncbi:MAG: DUF2752 domain-containing protein [Bacteroidia bacterium]|nr:DUF2752 domain-containing protein [Bacteroidia bacterium]NNF30968.1 DUF2752 domain-containing protein [Flavobacteriaceae bacterium]MBT8274930.1 DUF2752 domain-containing protein [Bacteroidia bacterium]NNJ82613.1 DUF2752 domain-containing protein [Flavobacteriaceae bacterium]NNK53145.1 DUF2752 domain-containing protein [Flavobacteriaceae bacterium]
MDSRKIIAIALTVVILGGGFIYYYFNNPTNNSLFLPCPFKLISGYNCPGCGSQRAIHQLLHGNIGSAFYLNPLMVLSIPLIVYGLGTRAFNYIFETSHRVRLFYSNVFIYSYFGLAIVYWFVRNLSIYPFPK